MFEHDNEEHAARQRFTRRALLAGASQIAGFSALGWRLFQLQVVGQSRYAPMAEDNRISLQFQAPKRGRILDRTGLVLAENDEIFRATLTPGLTPDVELALSRLRRIVPFTQDELEKITRRARKQGRNTVIVVASDLTFEQVAQINLLAPQFPGIRTEIAWRRKYHHGPAVGHVVGYVGGAERSGPDDEGGARIPGMRVGKSGIEAGMEVDLRGTRGAQKIEVDAKGHIVRSLETVDAKPGRDLNLSIDAGLHKKILARMERERRAACVVLDVVSGEVAVMASVPGYDPADISGGITDEAWQRLANAEDKPMLNRAVAGQYPPGSTFKMVTALAALQSGLVTAGEQIVCEGTLELAGHTYRCQKPSGHGRVGLHEALCQDCDVYFYEMARRLGIEALADMSKSLGVGQTFPLGLTQQRAGLSPDPESKRSPANWSRLEGESIMIGIGQGAMLATPLQLAVMTARIATGKAVMPSLLKTAEGAKSAEFPALAIDERFLLAVRQAMAATVNGEAGAESSARLPPGQPQIAGKTGSSQLSQGTGEGGQDGLAWDARDHALFVAFVPSGAPRFAVAAIVEHGGSGGATAALLTRDVIEVLLATYAPASQPAAPPAEGEAPAPVSRQPASREG